MLMIDARSSSSEMLQWDGRAQVWTAPWMTNPVGPYGGGLGTLNLSQGLERFNRSCKQVLPANIQTFTLQDSHEALGAGLQRTVYA